MIYIECPSEYSKDNSKDKRKSLFIAGGITGCNDWQSEFLEMLRDEDIILYNPRRKNYPDDPDSILEEQIEWEHRYLKKAGATSFWFTKETLCPITLFELGKKLMETKPLFLGLHPDYARRKDLEIQVKLARPKIEIVYDIGSLYNQVRKWIKADDNAG